MIKLPGYAIWQQGGTREAMERANRLVGRACYCASLWSGYCDFCSGLAQPSGPRWEEQVALQREGRK